MKRYIILLIAVVALFATSCVTQKKCNNKFPPQTITIVKDSIVTKDSVVYKPVEVFVTIKGDTIVKYDTVFKDVKTGLINSKAVYAETEFAKAKAQVINSKLTLELIQKDSTFKVKTDSLNKEVYHWKEKYNSILEKQVVTKEVKVGKFYVWYFYISLIVLLGILGWKNRGLIIKLIKPI